MKRSTLLSLSACAGLLLQPSLTFAQDQVPDKSDTKNADSGPRESKEKAPAAKDVQKKSDQGAESRTDKSDDKTSKSSTAGSDQSKDTQARTEKMSSKDVQQPSQQQSSQGSTAPAVQGNRSNSYNGQWVAASTHSDWDISTNHSWNNHQYRYYDGGWLIIDTGESPGYYQSDSLVIKVKQSLAQQGYYNGHFSATVGPRTRQAISNYESAKGLPVTGQIDGPLVASLGLQ